MRIVKYTKWLLCCLTVIIAALFFSCGENGKVRKYKRDDSTKPAVTSAHTQMKKTLPARSKYSWDTPQDWKQEQNTSSFRVATFSIEAGQEKSTCTIIPLKGAAGGLNANVARWLGQIDISMEENKLEKFLAGSEKFKTESGLPVVAIDLTTVTAKPGDTSILAAVITLRDKDTTVFIKMTGKKSHLLENKEKFKALSRSLTLNTGQ
ncbi:MAG: hypothetical protein KAW12_11150 [Candidatus Aminicenantes bacterium]|nr:hypothetical protein [Candidatus Aminicenantes bacterium]